MDSTLHTPQNSFGNSKSKDRKKQDEKQLRKILFDRPMSRRMAATSLGYPDQTFMVTQFIFDWIKSGRAEVVGRIKCERSGKMVDAISTNPEYFRKKNDNREILWK